jgi:hypothetical protein
MWLSMQQEYGFKDHRDVPMKAAQEAYRNVGAQRMKLKQQKQKVEDELKMGIAKDRKRLIDAKLAIEKEQRALKGGIGKDELQKIIARRRKEQRRNEEKKLKSKKKK